MERRQIGIRWSRRVPALRIADVCVWPTHIMPAAGIEAWRRGLPFVLQETSNWLRHAQKRAKVDSGGRSGAMLLLAGRQERPAPRGRLVDRAMTRRRYS